MRSRMQFAALPFVVHSERVEVCLITSRDTGRWIIPKGWPQSSLEPHEVAALEAFEEAGLKGRISTEKVGSFHYLKRLDDNTKVKCEVGVFPMLVESHSINWPEQDQRSLGWFRYKKAMRLVDDVELADLFKRLKPKLFTSLRLVSPTQ